MSNARKISQLVVGTEVKISNVDSDVKNALTIIESRLDSDDSAIQSAKNFASNPPTVSLTDSDLKVVSDLRNQLDSEIESAKNLELTYTNYFYTATAGQTTFTGSDDNSATLDYTVGSIQVFLNGIILQSDDYTATSGTSIVLTEPAGLNHQLSIIVPIIKSSYSTAVIYTLSRSTASVNESDSFTISLATTNVASGTSVPFTITGIQSADIGGASLTGNFVTGTTDSFTFTATADATTEGAETFTMTLDGLGVSIAVTINDTSITSGPNWAGGFATTAILEGDNTGDQLGTSVAINEDGTLMAVGARRATVFGYGNRGHVKVYKRSSGTYTWTEKQTLVSNQYVSSTNNFYGSSVAIAASNDTIIVGNGLNDGSNTRGIHVWSSSNNGDSWSTQANLLASGVAHDDNYGHDNNIDISDDGNTLVIGAKRDDDGGSDAGAIYVYTRSGTSWTFRQKLNAGKPAGSRFGEHVRISGDGNYIAVGAPNEDTGGTNKGTVVIYYTPNGGLGWNLTASFQASDIGNNDRFGQSLAIDTDGDTVAIASNSTTARSVYVFTRSGSSWSQQAKLTRPLPESGDAFGHGSSNPTLSGDGDTMYIGSPGDDDNGTNSGKGLIYTRSGTTWSAVSTNVTPLASTYAPGGLRGVEASDAFGQINAISKDATTIVTGSDNHTNNSNQDTGAAYVMMPSNLI